MLGFQVRDSAMTFHKCTHLFYLCQLVTGSHTPAWPCSVYVARKDYDLFQALLDMPTGDHWDDAEMWTVFAYVRASKFLEMPEAYKPLLFTRAA